MSSSTAKGMSEEAFQKEQRRDDEDQPEVPKIWGFDDPFIYAPPKPASDPWSILLEPLMKKDKMQCEAWKEEVQNLLIFAGLFSAVVTAFIIESYRTLQPDPNDTIISLLSIIANRLDNTTIPTPILLSSTGLGSSFSPTTSSIRINNFWFISLVLSLATVLVGIISLQWIREHQNYPNLPPRESFALFNMRTDGLKRWHVPKIFTALPLLLQSALVLFLGGVIDFLLSFGDAAVIIPVIVVTVLVLLFLVATTILPTVQSLFLCLPYPFTRSTKVPPAQCPYKSPQAHAFRAILRYIILLWRKVFLGKRFPSSNRYTTHSGPADLATYIWITWTKTTWNAFDIIWLRLRDQFMQHSYHRLTERHPKDIEVELPVFDLFEAIRTSVSFRTVDVNVQNSILAQYHCFTEVSKWIVDPNTCSQPETTLWAIVQSNKYLGDLMKKTGSPVPAGLPTVDARDATTSRVRRVSTLLHEENMFFFLYKRRRLIDENLQKHLLELAMRLSTVIYTSKYNHYTTTTLLNCFSVPSRIGHNVDYDLLLWQWVNHFSTFFHSAAPLKPPYTSEGTWHIHDSIPSFIDDLARVSLHHAFSSTEGLRPAIQRKFEETFRMITESLNKQMSSLDFREPDLLFYITALYLSASKGRHETYHACLDSLLSTMRIYKERTIDAGVINHDVQEIYGYDRLFVGDDDELMVTCYFSSDWWDFLEASGSTESTRTRLALEESTVPISPDT